MFVISNNWSKLISHQRHFRRIFVMSEVKNYRINYIIALSRILETVVTFHLSGGKAIQ